MDNVTASEIAGLGVGALLLCAAIAAPKVDGFISASQRRGAAQNFDESNGERRLVRNLITGYGLFHTKGVYVLPWSILSLGMCKRCGNLKMIACTNCRGVGSIKEGLLRFAILDDLYDWIDAGESKTQSTPCAKCHGRGHFNCPDCFKT